MDERTQIALELTKAYIKTEKHRFDNSDEILFLAVEQTDLLLKLLSQPVNTVKLGKFDAYEEVTEEKEWKEESLDELLNELVEETLKKKGWF